MLRIAERGNEIHFAVRSSGGEVSQNLRDNLHELVRGMEKSGFTTELWKPSVAQSAASQNTPDREPAKGNQQDSRGSGYRQNQNNQEGSRRQGKNPEWLEEFLRQ